MSTTTNQSLAITAQPFLTYLDEWYSGLSTASLADSIGTHPEQVAVVSVDMINGFCTEGPLASARVGALSRPVAAVFQQAYNLGVRALVLTQDTHSPDTPEFQAYPPHCVAGTSESEAIDELKELPFYNELKIVRKNALNSFIGTDLQDWIDAYPALQTYIVVGDCSDLCVYTTAMHLRMVANAFNLARRVIVPANVVDTFDTPVATAQQLGIKAHDADLHHVLFLHHMAMNGVEVVRALH